MACGWLSEYTSFLDARPGEHGPHAVLAQPLDPTTFYGLRGKHSSETLLGSCKGEWVFMGEEPRLFVVRTDQTASDLHGKKKKSLDHGGGFSACLHALEADQSESELHGMPNLPMATSYFETSSTATPRV